MTAVHDTQVASADAVPEILVGEYSSSAIGAKTAEELGFPGPPALVVGYVSPDAPFDATAERVRRAFPPDTQVLLTMTAGELRAGAEDGSAYCPDGDGRDRVVLQSFSRRLVSAVHIASIPLGSGDIRAGKPSKTPRERTREIAERLRRVRPPFPIDFRDTVCYALVDGLSNSENFLMEAVYESGAVPCLLVGGSSGGKLDFKTTRIYDNAEPREDHAVLAFIKLAPGRRFGVFSSHNFVRTDSSFVILDCDVASRRVYGAFDERSLARVSFIEALCSALKCEKRQLAERLADFTFGVEIEEELYIRSVASVDLSGDSVAFYCDIDAGDRLFLLKKIDFLAATDRSFEAFLKGKSEPLGGILNDCILRRLLNRDSIGSLRAFDDLPVAGFSTFGELLGVNVNQTLTALFFFKAAAEGGRFRDDFLDSFVLKYASYKSYYLERRLARRSIISEIYRKTLGSVFESAELIANLSAAFRRAGADMDANLADLKRVTENLSAFSDAMETNGRNTASLYGQLRVLAERIKEIEGILSTITDIAERTDILSINASIQAARAGERGRGFAVVAGEVRNLSGQIRDNLHAIEATTGTITRSVDEVVRVVDGAKRELERMATENTGIREETAAIFAGIASAKDSLAKEEADVGRILAYLQELRNSRTVVDVLTKQRI